MQLIVDVDNIDIERKMSTLEQESLNEKFLANKVIGDLADDITTGNKENIQKQENIILDAEENNVTDSDKEVLAGDTEVVANNESGVNVSNDDIVDNEDVKTPDENTREKNIKNNSEQELPDALIIEKNNKEDSLLQQNEAVLGELNNTNTIQQDLEAESETEPMIIDKNPSVNDALTVKDHNVHDDHKESTELNDNEIALDKEVDISELSTELNEEKDMDVDKEVDIAEVSTELNKENEIEVEDTIDKVAEKVLEKESVLNEVPTELDDKSNEKECSEIVLAFPNDTNEKNNAIEIVDDDEKLSEKNAQLDEKIPEILENVDKSEGSELIDKIDKSGQEDNTVKKASEKLEQPKRICRLSNNLDIFSDEEDDPGEESPKDNVQPLPEKQCINIDDDDDIMVIDEDSNTKDNKKNETKNEVEDTNSVNKNIQQVTESTNQSKNEIGACIESKEIAETNEITSLSESVPKDINVPSNETANVPATEPTKIAIDKPEESEKVKKPLLPKNFINTCKKNLSDMTRNDLEEFCILKIVESIVDRSNLGEIKAHLKNLTQTMEECKKKCLMLSKQNKDLQVVLKSVQEEQKSGSDVHITPLKITRSVGMQVVMVADKSNLRKKTINGVGPQAPVPNNNTKQAKNQQPPNTRNQQKDKAPINQQIPVPRLVPATPPLVKTNQTVTNAIGMKQINNNVLPNGMKTSSPVQKIAEKRARSQAVTVDLTDDEPPPKLQNVQRGAISQPMRVLTTGPNLIPPQRFNQSINSPRKVYIPISGPQAQNVRPGQTIMLKTLSGLGPRSRAQAPALITKSPQTPSPVRFARGQPSRHPAPLPDAMKQYQPPNWKSLPPAPDLKLSKVENGIVISWKIDGYQEENHEEIASYQLYAYQETSSPPNTALWKKIGDVKALPLPMACTLTQFMSGYKYYFAVRAVDIRSRFGPFSLPGSILLLNKI